MIQDLKQTKNPSEEKNRIDYIKRLIDDLYEQKACYSLSLYTLELTRRFRNSYESYKKEGSTAGLKQVSHLALLLEEKLMNEGSL